MDQTSFLARIYALITIWMGNLVIESPSRLECFVLSSSDTRRFGFSMQISSLKGALGMWGGTRSPQCYGLGDTRSPVLYTSTPVHVW